MSDATSVPIGPDPTVAQIKLAAAAQASNPSTVAKQTGSTANTVRLLIAGAVKPTSRTIERYQAIGIEPHDWFAAARDVASNADGATNDGL